MIRLVLTLALGSAVFFLVPRKKPHSPNAPKMEKKIALTFDACGGPGGSGYDEALIHTLIENQCPATLFVTDLWASENPRAFRFLSTNSLFEIENHGFRHRPLSFSGKGKFGLQGTKNSNEAREEIEGGARMIQAATGRKPRFFRPAALYYETETLALVESLGYQLGRFTLNGDAGASLSAKKVRHSLSSAKSGDVVLCHMNHPKSGTAEGIRLALADLKASNFVFVRLSGLAVRQN